MLHFMAMLIKSYTSKSTSETLEFTFMEQNGFLVGFFLLWLTVGSCWIYKFGKMLLPTKLCDSLYVICELCVISSNNLWVISLDVITFLINTITLQHCIIFSSFTEDLLFNSRCPQSHETMCYIHQQIDGENRRAIGENGSIWMEESQFQVNLLY